MGLTKAQLQYLLSTLRSASNDDLERAERTYGRMTPAQQEATTLANGETVAVYLDQLRYRRSLHTATVANLNTMLGEAR